ncbi:hypothetical protein Pr1d_14820 [Bythopirellula goksoeyrii]|uniref:Type II secretion system protein H n=2 Tax=Bythopirellula goksoeyrii TaxID=1400387 RepID=A0A5B9Q925_9BACT|nr:hypothetical protein Pr1d_14820 [Bythopirellula goksoeyrii]
MDSSQAYQLQPMSQPQIPARFVQRSAFSLIEMTIVLLIIGILAGIAIPKFDTALKATRARGAANLVKSDLNYARRLAQQSSSSQSVSFDAIAESYALVGVNDIDRRNQFYVVNLSDSKYDSQIDTVDFAGTSNVKFDIHGRPDNPGTIVISSGSTTETIQVNSEGQVLIQ